MTALDTRPKKTGLYLYFKNSDSLLKITESLELWIATIYEGDYFRESSMLGCDIDTHLCRNGEDDFDFHWIPASPSGLCRRMGDEDYDKFMRRALVYARGLP